MKGLPEERAIQLAQYIIEQDATVRQAAGRFAISKSTVHKDISQRLEKISPSLHQQVRQVLERNKQERHIRGVGWQPRKSMSSCVKQTKKNKEQNREDDLTS